MTIWATAYIRHQAAIRAYLRRRVGPDEADDLCQETYERAVVAGDALREPGRIRAYLFRIAHNLMVSHLRRRGRVFSAGDLDERIELEALMPAAGHDGPEARASYNALAARLAGLLSELPADQRRAFELGALERRPYASIAAECGWSVAKVKIEVYRARRRLIAGLDTD